MAVKLARFEMPKRVIKEEGSATDTYGKFVAEPFEAGLGHTIGNSLRRVLLSSLEGAAITSVKIDGIQHEFSTISGVLEDVSEIILNLKRVLLVSHSREPKVLELKVKRKGEIVAGDFKADATVEILNPDQLICTATAEKKISMQATVSVGRGYVPSELNKLPDQPIGVIAMDSVFSPVRRVKYYVENTRVGQQMNYDRLVMEVWTDGRLTPDEALKQASAILRLHFNAFVDYDENYVEFEAEEEKEEDAKAELRKMLETPIGEIELSVRAANCIAAANIKTIRDLVQKTEAEMLKYRNFGKKSLNEIKAILEGMGLSLGMDLQETLGPKIE
ncbi:DNA-directed RNA polymerase subunit alpha [bacterium]|nr:DNA-directed RNA polymerase subunit alpha [bacterium]